MSTTTQRDLGKERFWRRAVRQWRKGGLSAREFCRQQNYSEPSFYAWRRALQRRDAEAVRFRPVRIVSTSTPSTSDLQSTVAGLELLLEGGRRLTIGPGFDGATLRRLLAVLEEGRPCS